MNEVKLLEEEIKKLEEELEDLRRRHVLLAKKEEKKKKIKKFEREFEQFRRDSLKIALELDNWKGEKSYEERTYHLLSSRDQYDLSLLFLGGCSGEWAARTRFRGNLPGFGGFLLYANKKKILVDPGRLTYDELLAQGIHPAFLDLVIVTHSHWDCTRDLRHILLAACPSSIEKNLEERISPRRANLRLLAHESVLYGIPMNHHYNTVIDSYIKTRDMKNKNSKEIDVFKKKSRKFTTLVPGVLNVYDLMFRLQHNFDELQIDRDYELGNGIQLSTHTSYHRITFSEDLVPGLDFFISRNSHVTRCVYLSDTEYNERIADSYRQKSEIPIDILICNVKTLDTLKNPKTGFTRRHLGWDGLLKLSEDFKQQKLLTKDSLVVLRAWGLETVTEFPRNIELRFNNQPLEDNVLLANTQKLKIYKEIYESKAEVSVMIPGISWVDFSRERKEATHRQRFYIYHIKKPYPMDQEYGRFGNVFYASQAMHEVVKKAWSVTDDPTIVVVITGPSGVGKDELAKGIHQMAKPKRTGDIININSRQFTSENFYIRMVGNKKAVFTGVGAQTGIFESLRDGTIVLEEVHQLPQDVQTAFLTLLQDRKFTQIGAEGEKPKTLTAQLIFTTDRNLKREVDEGRFQPQFYHRINQIIEIPPLKDRKEDIPVIIDGWRMNNYRGLGELPVLDPNVISFLQEYSWPGNVRQLYNCITELRRSGDWSLSNLTKIVKKFDEEECQKRGPIINNELDKKILQCLSEESPMTRSKLETIITCKRPTLLKHLKQLKDIGIIEQIGNGKKARYKSNFYQE